MRQQARNLGVSFCIIAMLWVSLGWAEETPPLKKGVLVLPFQASEGLAEDEASLGVAVQNVIENMLTLHSDLEEVWCNWHLAKLFPGEEDFHNWIRGKGEVPPGLQALGFRYLLTGSAYHREDQFVATMELLDRTSGNKHTKDVVVDLPALDKFRAALLTLLDEAGIPVPTGQREKMLWAEDLPLPAFVLLGRGVEEYYAVDGYRKAQGQWNAKPFEEGLTLAPQSYLLSNSLGWIFFVQKNYPTARIRFERALAVNPNGADAADGLMMVGIQTDDERLGETWAKRKAENQGRTQHAALARWWWIRADIAHEQGKPQRAIELLQKAREYDPTKVQYIARLAQLYQETQRFTEGKVLIEEALTRNLSSEQRRTLRLAEALTLTSLGIAHYKLSQYEKAIAFYTRALAIRREMKDRTDEGALLTNLGEAYQSLSQYDQALRYYEQALTIHREVKNRAMEGSTLRGLGRAYQSLSQYDTAIAYYEQALAIKREVKDRAGEGSILDGLGMAYSYLSQYDRAIEYFEQALVITREFRNPGLAEIRVRIGHSNHFTQLATARTRVRHY